MAKELDGFGFDQGHGKARVRVARVWRNPDGRHSVVEWSIAVTLLSDCFNSYFRDDNSDIVAPDTMKNTLGSERHTTEVIVEKSGLLKLTSNVEGLALLKTTKSGFEGFIRDKYTALPEIRERILATEVPASWREVSGCEKSIVDTCLGPPKEGAIGHLFEAPFIKSSPDISSVQLKMPNLHFLPVNLSSEVNSIVKFEDDVYLRTDEPHGSIEASLSRYWAKP